MGQTNRSAKLKLFAEVDAPTLQRSIAHFKRLEEAERGASDAMVDRIQKTRQSLAASVANAKQESIVSAETVRAIDKQRRSREELIKTIDRQANAERNALLKGSPVSAVTTSRGGGGRASGALSALGSVLPGTGGDIARSAGNLARLTEQITRLSSTAGGAGSAIIGVGGNLTAMAAILPAVGIALVAVGIAFQAFLKKIQEGKDQLAAAVDSQRLYYEAIETGTTESIKAQIEARQHQVNVEKKVLNDLTITYSRLSDEQRAADLAAGEGSLTDTALKLETQIGNTEAEIAKLDISLVSVEVKANDAAAAQKKLAEETDKAAEATEKAAKAQREAVLGAGIEGQLKYFEIIATGTRDTVQKALEAAQIQKQISEQQLSYLRAQLSTASGDEAVALTSKINQLEQSLARSRTEVASYTRALMSQSVATNSAAEAAKEAADGLKELYTSIVERGKQAAEQLAKTEGQRQRELQNLRDRYADEALDQVRQQLRDEAREQRRASFDRLIALKQRELTEFDLLLRGDFAGVAQSRRAAQVQDEIDRYRGEFEASEQLIAQREQSEDAQISRARELATIQGRADEARKTAATTELEVARAAVAEYFKLKGWLGDVSRFSEEAIMRIYQRIQRTAGVPGVPPPSGEGIKFNPNVPVRTSTTPVRAPSAPQTTGSAATNNYTFNVTGNNPRDIARAIDERIRGLVRG